MNSSAPQFTLLISTASHLLDQAVENLKRFGSFSVTDAAPIEN